METEQKTVEAKANALLIENDQFRKKNGMLMSENEYMKSKLNETKQQLDETNLRLQNVLKDFARSKAHNTEIESASHTNLTSEKKRAEQKIHSLEQEIEKLKEDRNSEAERHQETQRKYRSVSKKARAEQGKSRLLTARLEKSEFRNSEQQKEIQYLHRETTFPPRNPNSGNPEDVDEAVTEERFRLQRQDNGAV